MIDEIKLRETFETIEYSRLSVNSMLVNLREAYYESVLALKHAVEDLENENLENVDHYKKIVEKYPGVLT